MRDLVGYVAGREYPDLISSANFKEFMTMRTKPHLRIKRGGKWGYDAAPAYANGGLGISYRAKLALRRWCKERNTKEGR